MTGAEQRQRDFAQKQQRWLRRVVFVAGVSWLLLHAVTAAFAPDPFFLTALLIDDGAVLAVWGLWWLSGKIFKDRGQG